MVTWPPRRGYQFVTITKQNNIKINTCKTKASTTLKDYLHCKLEIERKILEEHTEILVKSLAQATIDSKFTGSFVRTNIQNRQTSK